MSEVKHRVEVVELDEDELDYEGQEEIYTFRVIIEFKDNTVVHIPSDYTFRDKDEALKFGKEHSYEMAHDLFCAIQRPVVDSLERWSEYLKIPIGLD